MMLRRTVGVILIVIGVVALAWGGISWTHRKTVVDTGPLKIQTTDRDRVNLPPVLGVVSLIGGIVLLVIPRRVRV